MGCMLASGLLALTVTAVALHAAENIVYERAADGQEDDGTARNLFQDPYLRIRECEPGYEGTNRCEEEHHDKRPRRLTTFRAKLHVRTPDLVYLV